MASGLTTFLVVATVGVGGYALYRWWDEDKRKGDHWRRKEAQHLKDAHVSGYFAGFYPPYGYPSYGYPSLSDYYVGDTATHAPDPRNCLCPMTLDPLDARLPTYTCPCNVPGAIRPPYAGYMAVGRGGGGGHYRPQQQQQQQQQEQQQDGGGPPGDPNAPPPQPPPYPQPPQHRPHHPHHGRR
jgi:hypothetical protein